MCVAAVSLRVKLCAQYFRRSYQNTGNPSRTGFQSQRAKLVQIASLRRLLAKLCGFHRPHPHLSSFSTRPASGLILVLPFLANPSTKIGHPDVTDKRRALPVANCLNCTRSRLQPPPASGGYPNRQSIASAFATEQSRQESQQNRESVQALDVLHCCAPVLEVFSRSPADFQWLLRSPSEELICDGAANVTKNVAKQAQSAILPLQVLEKNGGTTGLEPAADAVTARPLELLQRLNRPRGVPKFRKSYKTSHFVGWVVG